jgi:kynurenine formamidase
MNNARALMLVVGFAASAVPHAQETRSPAAVIDLAHPMRATDPTFSGKPVYSRTVRGSMARDGYVGGTFSADEHFGTHVDAPAHFAENTWTVDQIPAERLVRPGYCIDVSAAVKENDDYEVTLEDVRRFEEKHGKIAEGSVVLVATGWDARWKDPVRYRNQRAGALHFPGLSLDAAMFLARERRVAGIGIDTLSVDHGLSKDFAVHKATQPHGVYHIENAANLTKLPPRRFTVVVAPLAIAGGSGSPARVFALLNRSS